MSESTELVPGTTAPMPVRREYARVDSAMGIMDTARFEHLGRVAQVMARAGLMPMSLTHEKQGNGDNAPMLALPPEVIVARAYLIANQADLWNADPMAVAQCTSLVHGKLMYEGKLVHGILSAKLGVDLLYEFGTYDAAKRDIKGTLTHDPVTGGRIWEGVMPTAVDDQGLGVRVVGTLPGETRPRTISGSVGMWHKGPKSPWGSVTAWPRQLRYMGAREWARAHKPSLLLGIITDDEIEEYDLARQVGHIAPAGPQMLHAGFEDNRRPMAELERLDAPKGPETAKESVAAKRAAKKAEAEKAMEAARAAQEAEKTTGGTGAPETGSEAITALAGVLGGDDLPDNLKGAQEAVNETMTTAATRQAVDAEIIEPGHAEPGEEYVISGEEAVSDGRRVTYKDGGRFSGRKDWSELKVYAEHSPLVPTENELPADMPEDLRTYATQVTEASDFQAVKKALAELQKTPTWQGMDEQECNGVRYNTWDIMVETGLAEKLDPAADVSAYRLWLEHCEEPEEIEGMLSTMEEHADFKAKSDTLKETIRGATQARLEELAE